MERTYVFNQDGGAASGNGLLASILPSLQNRGIDTGYLMGLLGGGNGNGGFFGNNGDTLLGTCLIKVLMFNDPGPGNICRVMVNHRVALIVIHWQRFAFELQGSIF